MRCPVVARHVQEKERLRQLPWHQDAVSASALAFWHVLGSPLEDPFLVCFYSCSCVMASTRTVQQILQLSGDMLQGACSGDAALARNVASGDCSPA